jgi:DNA-binding transcriptional LysR family regulator
MIRRLPPLRSLEAFIRVVRAGSAKTAAAELALSPSALSRRLGALEEFVGKPVFERKHQLLKLTDDGQALYDAVAPLIDEMADRIDRLIDTGQVLRLRLGVLPLSVSLLVLVRGLYSLGVGPRDLITILQAIKAAGALQAELEVR